MLTVNLPPIARPDIAPTRWAYLVLLVLTAGVLDALGTMMGAFYGDGSLVDSLFIGALCSQIGLVAVWLVFGLRMLSFRLCAAGLAAIALAAMLLVWNTMAGQAAAFLACYALAVVASALAGRLVGLCWIDAVHGDELRASRGEPNTTQFSIRDLLVWTTLAGVLLILYRRVEPNFQPIWQDRLKAVEFMAGLGTLTLAAIFTGLSALRWMPAWLGVAIAAAWYTRAVVGPSPGLPAFLVCMPVIALAVTLPFRYFGYRLTWQPWWRAR